MFYGILSRKVVFSCIKTSSLDRIAQRVSLDRP